MVLVSDICIREAAESRIITVRLLSVQNVFKEIMGEVLSTSHKASWAYKEKQPQTVGMHEESVEKERANYAMSELSSSPTRYSIPHDNSF